MLLPVGDDNSARRTVPYVTYFLVLANISVFLVELAQGEPFIIEWSFVPQRFLDNPGGEFLTLFTCMFMHVGWFHIVGNMLYLWIFADNVEDNFGHFRFLAFYLACGLVATFSQMALDVHSEIPSLGASGAIAGALGAYVLLFPKARVKVLLWIVIVPVPAYVVLGLWIIMQLLSGVGSILSPEATGGVAYMAHIGGFAAGLILAFILRRRTGRARGGWDNRYRL